MKIALTLLTVAVLLLAGAVIWLARPVPLTAMELAKGTGVHVWLYRIPDSYQPKQIISLEVTTAEGTQFTGGVAGLRPGETVKVFVKQSDDRKTLQWSIVGETVVSSSSVTNPFVSGSGSMITSYAPDFSVLRDNVLMRGSASGQLSSVIAPTDTVIRIVIHDG